MMLRCNTSASGRSPCDPQPPLSPSQGSSVVRTPRTAKAGPNPPETPRISTGRSGNRVVFARAVNKSIMLQRGGLLLRRSGSSRATPRRSNTQDGVEEEEEEEWEPSYCMPAIRPVPRRTSLLDFFRAAPGEEREVLLRRSLAGTGVVSSAVEEKQRWAATARAFTPRTWQSRRQRIREACRAKLRRALRKLAVVNAWRRKGGPRARGGRAHNLYRILYMPPAKRTDDDVRRVHAHLKGMRYFASFSAQDQLELSRCVTLHGYEKGATVFRQGDDAFSFFVVLSGSASAYVDVELQGSSGDGAAAGGRVTVVRELVGSVSVGDAVGDQALLSGKGRRETTLIASDRLELLRLTKDNFVRVVRQLAAQVHERKVLFLRRVPALRLLPSEEVEALAVAMELRVFNTGQHVWTQGERSDGLAFAALVLHGEVGLMKDIDDDDGDHCAFQVKRTRQQDARQVTQQLAHDRMDASSSDSSSTSGDDDEQDSEQEEDEEEDEERRSPSPAFAHADSDGAAVGGTTPPAAALPSASKPVFRLKATLSRVLNVTTRLEKRRRRRSSAAAASGRGCGPVTRGYDVCLAVLARYGVAVTRERGQQQQQGEEAAAAGMATTLQTLLHTYRTQPGMGPPPRDCSLVALTAAEVGIISRFSFLQVLRRNPWAMGPVLDVVVSTPPTPVLVSMVRRARWWKMYKRRLLRRRLRLNSQGRSQHDDTTPGTDKDKTDEAPAAATLGQSEASGSLLAGCCEAWLPLRKPVDPYPLSHLHAIASADPSVLFEATWQLEDRQRPRVRPAPPSTRHSPRAVWPARRGLLSSSSSSCSSSCSSTPSAATDDSAWLQQQPEHRPGRRLVDEDGAVRGNLQQLLRQLHDDDRAATRRPANKTKRVAGKHQHQQRRTARSLTARLRTRREAPSATALATTRAAAAAVTLHTLLGGTGWWASKAVSSTTTREPLWQPEVTTATGFSMQPQRPQPPPPASTTRPRAFGQGRPGRVIKPAAAAATCPSPRWPGPSHNGGNGSDGAVSSSDDDDDDDDDDDGLVRLVEAISPATSPKPRGGHNSVSAPTAPARSSLSSPPVASPRPVSPVPPVPRVPSPRQPPPPRPRSTRFG